VLTGFILLRMGQISQLNDQPTEAKEIYKTVLNTFSDKKLKEQAQKLYEGVTL
jgi:TolA-binding protein